MITLETEIDFKQDPWEVPQPRLHSYSNSRCVPLSTRLTWYALLHVENYPVRTRELCNVLKIYGDELDKSEIGHAMRKLCAVGFFTRELVCFGRANKCYRYTPTNMFRVICDEWRDEVN